MGLAIGVIAQALVDAEGRTMGDMLEQLAQRAQNGPDGYFLRTAAMQSCIAAIASLNLMARFVDEDEQIRIVRDVGIQARRLKNCDRPSRIGS